MNSVFISGSISIKTLPIEVIKSFDKIISQNIHVYVGDADGIDTLTQKYFASKNYTNVTVCTIYDRPRNIVSNIFDIKQVSYDLNIKSEREKQTSKDRYMTSNTGYTPSEIVAKIKASNIYTNISKVSELKEWLVSHKIFKEYQNKIEIDSKYQDYFIVENYRGNQIIKYKQKVLDLIGINSIFGVGK